MFRKLAQTSIYLHLLRTERREASPSRATDSHTCACFGENRGSTHARPPACSLDALAQTMEKGPYLVNGGTTMSAEVS